MIDYWANIPSLQTELAEVRDLMKHSISLKNKEVENAILEMLEHGGKMLRPAYQLLFSNFGKEKNREKRLSLAASIELLHTATLIHDDVVDKATIRRGQKSIAHQFGSDVAVYAGDYLFVTVFKILAKHSASLENIEQHAGSLEKILTGELGQMNNRYNLNMTVDEYIENISGKTAELFALSAFVGASESKASLTISRLAYEIGKNCGIAFQILDDLLDYTQNSDTLGKPVLEDMKQGVYSLPLLLALEEKRADLTSFLQKKHEMTSFDIEKIEQIIHDTNAIERAEQLANHYTEKSLKKIKRLPLEETNSREILYELTKSLVERKR
ncbi:heptaprenyl diphosphate synthase [Pilibacter termitis]|uniref:Heptaprenyl diphosphate synthase n=1 Tax=Pilibacter termitis TaxID=263852 RepID=A0A1T4NBE0_9ENTE|nr:polyprenyl synthetase family protein [Pilibacter termitis]SJZ76571.1 heptaprenyl diphosphate synthase [Pilibacter termitis]